MQACSQSNTQNVLQHGLSVYGWFEELLAYLAEGRSLSRTWRLPEWIHDPLLLQRLLPMETLRTYQIFHDCGKPYCIEYDEQGKRHFPNHEDWSWHTWLNELGGDRQVATLMQLDMDIHRLKACELEDFAALPEAVSLILTGLCEVHSNADMFGGIESTSFKIKYKQIEKRGRQVLEILRKG